MQIKGFILHSRKEFVIENFGIEAWEKVLASLPDQDRSVYQGFIMTSNWYDFEIGKRLDEAIVEVLGKGSDNVFEEIGRKSAKRHLGSIHAGFLTPGDPQAFLQKTSTIYDFYYDKGYREYDQTGPNSGIFTTYQAETFSVPDCLTVIGWYKEALEMCGAKNVRIEEKNCRAKGDDVCQYHVEWDI